MANDSTAINQFSKFNLDAENIANLHFGTSMNSANAATLVNFVDSQANINGIVNAVQNGQMGGNLYFISSEGIAVGSSGVINAGKVGLISPTNQAYQNLLDNAQNITDSTFSAENLKNGLIPLNYTGSITVEGRINAVKGITLAAANIDKKRRHACKQLDAGLFKSCQRHRLGRKHSCRFRLEPQQYGADERR